MSSFLRDIPTRYKILAGSFFPSALKKWCATSGFHEWEILAIQAVVPLYVMHCFSISRYFSVFSFLKFDYDVSWHGFLCVCPVLCLLNFFKSVRLYLLPNLGKFESSFLQLMFYVHTFSPLSATLLIEMYHHQPFVFVSKA
jgi:hypothetical protein